MYLWQPLLCHQPGDRRGIRRWLFVLVCQHSLRAQLAGALFILCCSLLLRFVVVATGIATSNVH